MSKATLMVLDKLAMLLSTDWFLPYWSDIGIVAEESVKSSIQRQCREIVAQILSGVQSYYQASFSDDRKNQTRLMFESMARQSKAETVERAIEEWEQMTDEELKAASIYTSLTDNLFSNDIRDVDPKLDSAIAAVIIKAQRKYKLAPFEFLEKCESSDTPWDRYTRELTPQQPTALADNLAAVLTARRFEAFWNSVRDRLTPAQREDLMIWYREMAKAHGRRDLVPTCVI